MSKIAKALHAISSIIKNPVLLNRVLQDPDIWYGHVDSKYKMAHGLQVISPGDLFGSDHIEHLDIFTFLDGGSLVTDITLLRGLAKKFKACSYFEIGTWRGESVVNVSGIAESCYTLNLSDDELKNMKVSEKSIGLQGFFSRDVPGITQLYGNSRDFDFEKLNRKFDLIFIDGSHHYDDVKNDTIQVFRHLVHEKSIVVWHDYGVNPEQVRFEVLAGILDGLDPGYHPYLYHVAHTKSAIYLNTKIKATILDAPVRPEGYYTVTVKYKSLDKRAD